ncbi:MAG TPA: hypothetical protein HA348_04940 [Thermoplasmata archaeon]|mgnify:CR=1 FL=1|nr:hypothetical protein [Thermoplasmata archaeon]
MRLGDKAKEVAVEHVKQKAARDVLNGIKEWRSNKIATARRRWIFELIQNAVDTAKSRSVNSLKIEIQENEDTLTFKHNGGNFTLDEISAVIYGGSTKPYAPESEYIGRFGTGFLVTHIVSRKIEITGFASESESQIYEFRIDINRESDKEEDISQSIEKCFSQLNKAKPLITNQTELYTEFLYFLTDDLGKDAVKEGIEELRRNLPFIFAFNEVIQEIDINGEKFYREIETENNLTIVKFGNCEVYTTKDEDSKIQVGILVNDEEISGLNDYPKIFIGMPLTETADYITIPFVIHSIYFDSTKERDAISLDSKNSELLKSAFELYEQLLKEVLEIEKIKRLFNFLNIQLIPDNVISQNPLWKDFNGYLKESSKQIMESIPLVDTFEGRKAVKDVIFPLNTLNSKALSKEMFKEFYILLSQLKKNIPQEDWIDNWSVIAEKLKEINDFSELIMLYDIEKMKNELVDFVKGECHYPTFKDFNEKFGLDNSKQFLLSFYEILNEVYQEDIVSESFIDYLLPDQTGAIGQLTWDKEQLHIDKDIPKELKDILHKIGWKIRQELVDNDFVGYEIIKDYVRNTMDTDSALGYLIKDDTLKPDEDKLKKDEWGDSILGWIELFRWCVKNNKLTKGFSIITKNKTIREIENLDEERLIIPFKHMNIEEKYDDIYPETRMIHQKYFESEDSDEFLNSLQQYKAFVTKLPIYKRVLKLPYNKLNSIIKGENEVSKVDHEIEADEQVISILPFWNEVIGKISEYQERAKLFFEFVVKCLIGDDSWEKSIHVSCSCKVKEHEIIPSHWLASLKSDAWIPYKTVEDSEEKIVKREATKESIENLFTSEEIDELIKINPDKITKLLPHFGFDELDLTIKLHSIEKSKSEELVRKELSKLVKLTDVLTIVPDLPEIATYNPDAFKEAIEKLRERLQKEPIKDENRKIGENLEEIIEKILIDKGFTVRPIYKGGDLEIWPEDVGWDSGLIEIEPYLLEVKFTSGNRVHLSRAQSEMARSKKENYGVLVVENIDDLRERLKEMDENSISDELISIVEENSRVIEKIYTKLGDFPDPEEIEPDLHGYWVKKKLWRDKKDVIQWIEQKFGDGV